MVGDTENQFHVIIYNYGTSAIHIVMPDFYLVDIADDVSDDDVGSVFYINEWQHGWYQGCAMKKMWFLYHIHEHCFLH